MKKIKEIYYIDNREERSSDFSTGFVFILEDGSKVETMTTDSIAEKYTKKEEIKLLKNRPEEKIIPINFLSSEKLRLKTHIAVAMKYSPEDENWIVDSPELNVYGVGRDEDEALEDFKSVLEESYFDLKEDRDNLGPRLEKEWSFFSQVIEEKSLNKVKEYLSGTHTS